VELKAKAQATHSRGDVVVLQGIAKGIRNLVVIIQSDAFAALPSVLVVPITFERIDARILRVPIDATDALPISSAAWAAVELTTAIPREVLGAVIGCVSPEVLRALDRAVMVVMGIA
jgi:mRNA-degrading endonuclease toxin of MazEF toxin-antitoxin module